MTPRPKRGRINLDKVFPELSGKKWRYAIYDAENLIREMLGASRVVVKRATPSLSWATVEVEYAPF